VYLGTSCGFVPRYTILGDFTTIWGTVRSSFFHKVSKNRVSRHIVWFVPRYTILGDFTTFKGLSIFLFFFIIYYFFVYGKIIKKTTYI
jgi:hypothetical protein